jgi:hypothetical protein
VKLPKSPESRCSGSHGRIPPDSGHAGHRRGMAAHSQELTSERLAVGVDFERLTAVANFV